MFTDSHAHLTIDGVYDALDGILDRAKAAQVETIVNITIDKSSLERALAFETNLVQLVHTGAVTPHDVEKIGEHDFPLFAKAAREGRLVAVGETGLDYYYEHSNREAQKEYFIKHLELAKECDLPIIIHCREAFEDLYRILDEHFPGNRVLLHCFTGTLKEAQEGLARGYMISMSGIVTFKRSEALREVAKMIPIEHLVVETDTPYLAPQSKRGTQNEPSFIQETVACLADVKQLSIEACAKHTTSNAKAFFSLGK